MTETSTNTSLHAAAKWMLGATAAICTAMAFILVLARGVWLDEIFTIYFSDPRLSPAELFRDRWVEDFNPPLYSVYMWVLRHLTGETIEFVRLANLGAVALLLPTAFLCRRYGVHRGFLGIYALVLLSNPFTIVYFAEARSYFLQLALTAALVLQLQIVHFLQRSLKWGSDWPLILTLFVTIFFCFNLHYVGGLIAGGAILAEMIHQYRQRFVGNALALLVCAVIPGLVLIGVMLVILSRSDFYPNIHTSTFRGALIIGAMVGAGAVANLGAAWIALRQSRQLEWKSLWSPQCQEAHGYISLLLVTVIAVAVGLTALNMITHFLVPRYVIALVPLAAAPIAYLARDAMKERRLFGLVCANAILVAALATVHQASNRRWERQLPTLKSALSECPQTRILALNPIYFVPRGEGLWRNKDSDLGFEIAYEYMARQHALPIELVPRRDGAVARPSSECPTLIWLESNFFKPDATAADAIQAAKLSLGGDPSRFEVRTLKPVTPWFGRDFGQMIVEIKLR